MNLGWFFVEKGILEMTCWVVVSNMFYFHPYLGKIPILTNIFQMGWNHQLDWDARLHMSYVLKQVFIMKLRCLSWNFFVWRPSLVCLPKGMTRSWDKDEGGSELSWASGTYLLRILVHVYMYIYILPWWYTVMIKTCAAQLKAVRIWICDPT